MKHGEKIAPVAAALSAVSTLLCCLPVGFAGAAALGGLAAVVAPFQSWFIGASLILLTVGTIQLVRGRRACTTAARTTSVAILSVSAVVVLLVVLFPQVLAGLLADWLP